MLLVEELTKSYERKPLLRGITFRVQPGETVCLLGASGSGKSTILRIIAGLEMAEAGSIRWDGEDLAACPAHQRHFGFMFQDYVLFPHLSVAENVAYGLRWQSHAPLEREMIIERELERVGMTGFRNRRVNDLSGGEQQRVALARTLAVSPRLLLLDEPLAALDRGLRKVLLEEIRQILSQTGVPAIFVTHDQEEAYSIGDRILLLRDGCIIQEGSPEILYSQPVDAEAAAFLGYENRLSGKIISPDTGWVESPIGKLILDTGQTRNYLAGSAVSLILNGKLPCAPSNRAAQIRAHVEDTTFREDGWYTRVAVNQVTLHILLPAKPVPDEWVTLSIQPDQVLVFPP